MDLIARRALVLRRPIRIRRRPLKACHLGNIAGIDFSFFGISSLHPIIPSLIIDPGTASFYSIEDCH